MSVYELSTVSLPDGDFAASWFDDEQALWEDERLDKPRSLRKAWKVPLLGLHPSQATATDVLFNPNAYAVSDRVREHLARFPELEFLPIDIAGHGTFYLLHVLACRALPRGCRFRKSAGPGGNIAEVHAFPAGFVPQHAFFRLLHPPGSAAGRKGFCASNIYASAQGAQALNAACGSYLRAELKSGVVLRRGRAGAART